MIATVEMMAQAVQWVANADLAAKRRIRQQFGDKLSLAQGRDQVTIWWKIRNEERFAALNDLSDFERHEFLSDAVRDGLIIKNPVTGNYMTLAEEQERAAYIETKMEEGKQANDQTRIRHH